MKHLVDVSDIFYFFCSGEGKGVRGARKPVGGVSFFFFSENPRRGGSSQQKGGGGGRGAWRVSAWNLGAEGGGGAKYFFSGPKRPPRARSAKEYVLRNIFVHPKVESL